MRIKTRLLLFLIPAIFASLVVLTLFSYMSASNQAEIITSFEAQSIALKQSDLIFNKFRHAEAAASSLAFALAEMRKGRGASREAHTNIVRGVAASSSDYFGVWALWEPNAFDGSDEAFVNNALYGNEQGRANAYWMMDDGKMQYDPSEDYDKEQYYTLPKEAKRLAIIPPYRDMDTADKVLMTSVVMPIMEAGKSLGVVGIDIKLEFLHELISAIKPYETGYARLISDKGAIISQPGRKETISEKLPMISGELLGKIRSGKPFSAMETSPENGEAMQCMYTPVKLASFEVPWYFMVALPAAKVMAESNRNLLVQFGISVLALLGLVGIVFYTANSVSAPLRRIAGYAQDVAGGNHTAQVDRRGFMLELDELQTALRSMLDSLLASMAQAERRNEEVRREAEKSHTAMAQAEQAREDSEANRKSMLEIAGRVNAVSEKLQNTSHELCGKIVIAGRETQEQNTLMGKTVAAISQMANSTTQVSEKARDMARFTELTRERAKEGAAIVDQTLHAFASIRRETESLGGQISDLSARSESVGNILGMIKDIADQTNLLALNAAIEAARAGEAGRGFAVVADEVRKLAEKTVGATKQVEEAIMGMRSSMQISAQGVSRTAGTVHDTVELGTTAQSALTEIVTLVQGVSEWIIDIAMLCRQQAETSEAVTDIVESLRQSSITVSAAMEDSATIACTLEPEANELGSLVEQLSKK